MIIAKKPEEEFYEEGYGFFLGDIGKFIVKAAPAAVGGFLVTGGAPLGAAIGATTGFIGGKPSKVFKRFLYGVGAAGLAKGVTGLVAPEHQAILQGPLSSKIASILSKVKTFIPGMGEAGDIKVSVPGTETITGAKTVVIDYVSPFPGAEGKEVIKTGLESFAKYMIAKEMAKAYEAEMQYPSTPFQVYQLPPEEGGGAVLYDPQKNALIVPQPVVESAVEETKQEIESRKKPPVSPKPPVVSKPPIKAGIIEEKYLPYIILFTAMAIGVILAKR